MNDYGYIRADLRDFLRDLDTLLGNVQTLVSDCPLPLLKDAEGLLDMGASELGEAIRTLRQAEARLPLGKENKQL